MGWDTILPGEREELIRMKIDMGRSSYEQREEVFKTARDEGTLPDICEGCDWYKIPAFCNIILYGSCNESNLTLSKGESSLIKGAVAIRD